MPRYRVARLLKFQVKETIDTSKQKQNFFESEFEKEKKDSVVVKPLIIDDSYLDEGVLKKAKLFDYRLKFSADNFTAGFNNDVLVTKYQPYTGSLPIQLGNGDAFNAMFKATVSDLFEDIRFTGALRLPLFGGSGSAPVAPVTGGNFIPSNASFFDGGGEWFARIDYLKKRVDYSLIYYRVTQVGASLSTVDGIQAFFDAKSYTNLFQAIFKYPFDRARSLRLSIGVRTDKVVLRPDGTTFTGDTLALKAPDQNKQTYALSHLEYVYDNTVLKDDQYLEWTAV